MSKDVEKRQMLRNKNGKLTKAQKDFIQFLIEHNKLSIREISYKYFMHERVLYFIKNK